MVYISTFDSVHMSVTGFVVDVWSDSAVDSAVEFDLVTIFALLFCYVSSSYVDMFEVDRVYQFVYIVPLSQIEIIHVLINLKKDNRISVKKS